MRTTALIISLTLASASAHAGGLILNDFGASTTGRANASVATIDNGAAIFYNPAGLAAQGGVNAYLGASLILPYADYISPEGEKTKADRPTTPTPHLYVSGAIGDLVRVGVGVFTPFGSESKWPASSPGRQQSRDASLRTVFISPVVAFDLSQYLPGKLHVGGGFDLVPADVKIERDLLFGTGVGTVELGGTGFGFGGRVGVQYEPIPQLSLGVTYRSKVDVDFSGNANFEADPVFRSLLPPDGPITSRITLPQSVLAGVAYRPLDDLEVEFDVNWIDWRPFESLDIDLPDGTTASLPYDWNDVLVLRLGGEYLFRDLGLSARAGYAYDPTPIPATTLGFAPPDADRHVLFAGAGYDLPKGFHIDAAALYGLPVSKMTSDEPMMPPIKGEFDITFFVASVSLGYHWGGPTNTSTGLNGSAARL